MVPSRRRNLRGSNKTSPVGARRVAAVGIQGSHHRALYLPLILTVALVILVYSPRVLGHVILAQSFLVAALLLLVWQFWLFVKVSQANLTPSFKIELRPQHYIQAMVQSSVFFYWGWYWPPVYGMAWIMLGQLVFAYAFDILLSWSRGKKYVLGFGPFPIILSTNLFLWFKDDWFYLQFLMIAVGFLGKEFVRWSRGGRSVHIFNPSAFSLGLFSIGLLVAGATDISWGQQIASTLSLAPNIYLFLFSVGLVVMYFFSITLIAGSAAATLFILSAIYSGWSGVPYFVDSEIPTAVFLGLLLLVTDPSTSPRSQLGKIFFGCFYGLGVFGLYSFLGFLGVPTFYDKLLCVPLLNLSVEKIDKLASHVVERVHSNFSAVESLDLRKNGFHMVLWVMLFLAMSAMGKTDAQHTGDSIPFWEETCESGTRKACQRLLELEKTYCADNSGWACNELGIHFSDDILASADPQLASTYFSRACQVRFQAACLNLISSGALRRASPKIIDLRLVLREGGRNLLDMSEDDLYSRACDHGWQFACDKRLGP